MLRRLTLQIFARKLIHAVGGNQREIQMGIDNEVRAMTKLCSNGGHRNIITILQHGWLNKDQWYYFDMELCAINLDDFIHGPYITALGDQYFDPTCVGNQHECLKLWNIMRDITSGLNYIHGLREVHRDLKPQNGISIDSRSDVPVLLSVDAGAWKITDFGLTFEGTSRIKYTTQNSRGTQGYRAIEMLNLEEQEPGYVSKASDIWALGCILFELAFKSKAFSNDLAVWDYVYRTHKLEGQRRLEVNERNAVCVRELIKRTLEVDWWRRPTARDVLQLVDSLTKSGTSGSVFYVGETESESDSGSSSIPLEPPTESPSLIPPPLLDFEQSSVVPLPRSGTLLSLFSC